MAIKYVKVTKGKIVKQIMEKDLSDYLALGWTKIDKEPTVELFRKIV